ncbi:AraC family transcriptional regulator [Neolewinella persica]|uniref:AraC family transcriptional regulator n=1 Tax=Neolewinella persica TaxID=70998 RepID=UPI000377AEEB|nr:AraC family transcriptional regulator [Neolewinella persica]
MHHLYRESKTKGILHLWQGDNNLHREAFAEDASYMLTIAWNRGATQTCWVDDVAHQVPANGLILLIDQQTYRFERPENITAWGFNREFYCVIDHDAEVSCVGFIFYGFPSPMVLEADEKTMKKMELLLPVFADEFTTPDNIQGEMLRMLLKRLIIIITRAAKVQLLPEDTIAPEYDLSRQYSLLVEKHFREHHQVADYASMLFKSPKTLSNLFKKLGQKTPLQLIHERLALEGRRLLLYTDKPVGEIADELGFLESGHFSRLFKRVTGESPSGVRG